MTNPDKATKRRLAVEASCDPRTIEKVLAGEPVRGLARQRALAALTAAGYQVHTGNRPCGPGGRP